MQEVAHRSVLARLRPWLALVAVAAVCAAIVAAGDPAARALRYERNALLDGQAWRALTGHLVHLSWAHLGLNLAVAAVVVTLFRHDIGWVAVLLCAIGTSAGLFLGSVRLSWYAGLSGVLHGLIVFGALSAQDRDRRRIWSAVILVVAGKLVLEGTVGAPKRLAELIGAQVVVVAHLYGAISGVLAFVLLRRRR